MNPRLILASFLLLFSAVVPAQPKTNTEVTREYFPGTEKLKKVTEVRITRNMHGDIFNFYKKTTVRQTEFTELGKPVRSTKRITKLGRSGKPCYELFSEETVYDETGRPKHYEKMKCDKQRQTIKEYANGKVIFIRKLKRRRSWSGFWFFS
ncbi:MAG: hypothetical protein FD123_3626 [Bacteroidetes bacterium]|nr:MAG: hypothetical protein FD123_3626 [Bacteroidota bacterium]